MTGKAQTNFREEDMSPSQGVSAEERDTNEGADGTVPAALSEADAQETEPEDDGDEPEPEADEDVPEGSAAEVLAWVGDNRERAETALAKEQDSPKPRSGLSDELQKIIDGK